MTQERQFWHNNRHQSLPKYSPRTPGRCVSDAAPSQVGGRKLSSKMARLKRHFEKFGLKGLVDSNRDSFRGGTSSRSHNQAIATDDQRGAEHDKNNRDLLNTDSLVPTVDPAVVPGGDRFSPNQRRRSVGIAARFSPSSSPSSSRGLGKGKSNAFFDGSGRGDLPESRSATSVPPSSPEGNQLTVAPGGRKRSVWKLRFSGQQQGWYRARSCSIGYGYAQ